jgi:hypothetical protein
MFGTTISTIEWARPLRNYSSSRIALSQEFPSNKVLRDYQLTSAQLTTEIYLEPLNNPSDTGLEYSWNITAWVSNVTDLWAFQINLSVVPNENIINITNVWLPIWDSQYIFSNKSTVQPNPTLYDIDGDGYMERVLIGDSFLIGTGITGIGPFKLAVFEFEITKAPERYETINCTIEIDNPDTYLLNSTLNVISCTKTGAYYELSWQSPIYNPYLSVEPSLIEKDEYHNWNGTYFNVEIGIKNLDIGWNLVNVTFKLGYNATLLMVSNVTISPFWSNVTVDISTWGEIYFYAESATRLWGNISVFTIIFQIIGQGTSPPRVRGSYDESVLHFYDVILMDVSGAIPTEPARDGLVRIYCKITTSLCWLEVTPANTLLGPELVIGDQYSKTFQIKVDIKNLHSDWNVVRIQFRLSFDPSLVEVINVEEGPFLAQFNNTSTSSYTHFLSYFKMDDPIYGPNILVEDFLLPNITGQWDTFPEGNGTIAIITFRPLVQGLIETYAGEFNIIQVMLINKYNQPVPFDPPQNGTLTILPIEAIGRVIDVWMQYPSPFGGQGLMNPADLVVPQQLITLTAKVTYNWWPVPQKLVTFHVYDDDGNLFTNLQGVTDDYGHVTVEFRMPYYNAEDFFGVWTVNATVEVAEEVVFDIMQFHFDWLVRIWKVTTDKEEYMHLETVYITVEYGSLAQQEYDVTLKIAIFDELSYSIGLTYMDLTVGGASFYSYKNYSTTLAITIPWEAAAGQATIKVYFLEGGAYSGTAITPEAEKKIWILPL